MYVSKTRKVFRLQRTLLKEHTGCCRKSSNEFQADEPATQNAPSPVKARADGGSLRTAANKQKSQDKPETLLKCLRLIHSQSAVMVYLTNIQTYTSTHIISVSGNLQ